MSDIICCLLGKNISRIGVIGTKGTINSGTYERKIKANNASLEVVSMATPLLAPMIEEGFIFDDISNAIIRTYLSNETLNNIEKRLVLGLITKKQALQMLDPNLSDAAAEKLLDEIESENTVKIEAFLNGKDSQANDVTE